MVLEMSSIHLKGESKYQFRVGILENFYNQAFLYFLKVYNTYQFSSKSDNNLTIYTILTWQYNCPLSLWDTSDTLVKCGSSWKMTTTFLMIGAQNRGKYAIIESANLRFQSLA